MYFGLLVPEHSANPPKTNSDTACLHFPLNNSLWGNHCEGIYNTYLFQTAAHAEQLGLCDPNQMLSSNPTCKVHCAAPTCVPSAARPAPLPPCTEHCRLPTALSGNFVCPLNITSHKLTSTGPFLPQHKRTCSFSERTPFLAGKIKLLPNCTSAAHALAFPLTHSLPHCTMFPPELKSLCCGGCGEKRYHKSS